MKTIELSLPIIIKNYKSYLAVDNIKRRVDSIKESVSILFSSLKQLNFSSKLSSDFSTTSNRFKKPSLKLPSKKVLKFGLYTILLICLVFVVRRVVSGPISSSDNSQEIVIEGPKATKDLNQEFSFPVRDENGDEVSKVKYIIEKAELRDEILVQGRPVRAVTERTFLILYVKIVNDFDQTLEINATDYVRLSTNGNTNELFAPDIHNDPVMVQAISTKSTRVGFPIYENDENLELYIGEITGEKSTVSVSF